MKINKIMPLIIAWLVSLLFLPLQVQAIQAVASFGNVKGSVTVERRTKKLTGRKGLILNDQDVIVTGSNAKATILFRDGSEIRIFQKTRFIIEKSKETKSGSRKFINRIILKWGSFWGKFAKDKQKTFVTTPTATAGIKGTIVAFKERNNAFSASLSTGSISIQNDDETIDLTPGKMVQNVKRIGSIKDKIQTLPLRIRIDPDQKELKLPKQGDTHQFFLTLQLIDVATNNNISRPGNVYLSLQNDKIVFPEDIQLNSRGYARVKATILPFQKKDYASNGQLSLYAIMDGEQHIDVGAGQAILTYKVPKGAGKTIKIDINSGTVN